MEVAIVLVTFNRLKSLKKSLAGYENQSLKPKYIVVVDNGSDDGTADYLDKWKVNNNNIIKRVITSAKNLGGSGGFALGVKNAKNLDCNYLFLADDDAIPDVNMLLNLNKGYNILKKDGKSEPSAICTAIYNNGQHEYLHRCIVKTNSFGVKLVGLPEKFYSMSYFKVDILTFVGACINKEAIKKIGNIKSEYFIYFDDTEYSLRLNNIGDIYCIPSSIMYHNVGQNRVTSWKAYYDTRNWVDLVKKHFSKEKLYCTVLSIYLRRCSFIARLAKGRKSDYRKMCWIAIKDGLSGRLGFNKKFSPK